MLPDNITLQEKEFLRLLAKIQQETVQNPSPLRARQILMTTLGLDENAFVSLMGMMVHYGAVECESSNQWERFSSFRISPHAVVLARELDERDKQALEPEDIVTKVTETARKNRLTAGILIAFAILLGAGQLVQIIKNLKDMGAEQKPIIVNVNVPEPKKP